MELNNEFCESNFKEFSNDTSMGYQSLDYEGNFIDLNDNLCNILGYTRDELINLIEKAGKVPVERDSYYREI